MNNFQGVLEITSGLANAAVHRLKKTWAVWVTLDVRAADATDVLKRSLCCYFDAAPLQGIGAEGLEVYHSLSAIFEQSGFPTYRVEIRAATGPVIPYIGVYLTDISFLHEDSSSSSGELINFARLRKVADVILQIQQYQVRTL
jgi:hypothetical protein